MQNKPSLKFLILVRDIVEKCVDARKLESFQFIFSMFCCCCSCYISSPIRTHLGECTEVSASPRKQLHPTSKPQKLGEGLLQSLEKYTDFLKTTPSAADDRNRTPLVRPLQIAKARGNLVFICKLMVACGLVAQDNLCFRAILDLTLMQVFLEVLESRGVSPGRIYQLILTLTKVLHFLAFFSVANSVPLQASSFSTWNFLTTAAKHKRCGERQRLRAEKIIGPAPHRVMTREELARLFNKCLTWIRQEPQSVTKDFVKDYLAHLIVLILVSIPPPRTQVLSELRVNETLLYDGEHYMLSFYGEALKSRMPLVQVLPDHLTKPLRIWLEQYKPMLVKVESAIVFPAKSGGQRKDWSQLTKRITMQYLEKAIPASKFRYFSTHILSIFSYFFLSLLSETIHPKRLYNKYRPPTNNFCP